MKGNVFLCECGQRTTEPYAIKGTLMCVLCAQESAPEIVERRERNAERKYRDTSRNESQMRRWGSTW